MNDNDKFLWLILIICKFTKEIIIPILLFIPVGKIITCSFKQHQQKPHSPRQMTKNKVPLMRNLLPAFDSISINLNI